MSEMPGPEVAVKARAPFHIAPITMPIAASSSSAWMKAKFFRPLAGSTRMRSENILNASMSEVDGVKMFRSEEHTSELQSRRDLVCRLLLEKKKTTRITNRKCPETNNNPVTHLTITTVR